MTTSRCPGSYQGASLDYQCTHCHRLLKGYLAGYWYIKVPEFWSECPQKLKKEPI